MVDLCSKEHSQCEAQLLGPIKQYVTARLAADTLHSSHIFGQRRRRGFALVYEEHCPAVLQVHHSSSTYLFGSTLLLV